MTHLLDPILVCVYNTHLVCHIQTKYMIAQ